MDVYLRKMFIVFVIAVFAVSITFGGVAFLHGNDNSLVSSVSTLKTKVFDMQVKLRNVSTGRLMNVLYSASKEQQENSVKKLGAVAGPSYIFGIDYFESLLASYKRSPSRPVVSPGTTSFPDISPIGISMSKDKAILTVSVDGNTQIWLWKKANGKWVCNDIPAGYAVEGVEISMNSVSFTLYPLKDILQKRQYKFNFGDIPMQYVAPQGR